jgi:hypothetical protein
LSSALRVLEAHRHTRPSTQRVAPVVAALRRATAPMTRPAEQGSSFPSNSSHKKQRLRPK